MKLRTLSDRSGVTVASIKFYRRENLLPAGERITSTSQSYDESHLQRLELISTLRNLCNAPIAQIRMVTEVLDDPNGNLLDALSLVTSIVFGLPLTHAEAKFSDPEDPMISRIFDAQGWPNYSTIPRAALAEWLETTRGLGVEVHEEDVQRYARHFKTLAHEDLDNLGLTPPIGSPAAAASAASGTTVSPNGDTAADTGSLQPTPDQIVTQATIGMVTFNRLSSILRALSYAGESMSRMGAPNTRVYMGKGELAG